MRTKKSTTARYASVLAHCARSTLRYAGTVSQAKRCVRLANDFQRRMREICDFKNGGRCPAGAGIRTGHD